METSIKFCATCNQELPFESDEGSSYCTNCGRTAEASLAAARAENWIKRSKVRKWAWMLGGLPLLIALGFFVAPGPTIAAVTQALGLAFILLPIMGAVTLYRRWNGK